MKKRKSHTRGPSPFSEDNVADTLAGGHPKCKQCPTHDAMGTSDDDEFDCGKDNAGRDEDYT